MERFDGSNVLSAAWLDEACRLQNKYRYMYELYSEALGQYLLGFSRKELNFFNAHYALLAQQEKILTALCQALLKLSNYIQLSGTERRNDPWPLDVLADKRKLENGRLAAIRQFVDLISFISGDLKKPPVLSLDNIMARAFGLGPQGFERLELYGTGVHYLYSIRDMQNKSLRKGEQPYEGWQIQSLIWWRKRQDFFPNDRDPPAQVLQDIVDWVMAQGLLKSRDGRCSLTREALMDSRVRSILLTFS